jgi:MerR family regulatory protein
MRAGAQFAGRPLRSLQALPGLSIDTLRYYDRAGLLRAHRRRVLAQLDQLRDDLTVIEWRIERGAMRIWVPTA